MALLRVTGVATAWRCTAKPDWQPAAMAITMAIHACTKEQPVVVASNHRPATTGQRQREAHAARARRPTIDVPVGCPKNKVTFFFAIAAIAGWEKFNV